MRIFNIMLAGLCIIVAASCNQPVENEMNAVIENIMGRRSIRNYKAVPVGRDTLQTIMECGVNAPNGQNKQSWEVRVVDDPELLAQMSQAMGDAHPGVDFARECFRGAPVMVFIARDLSYDFSAYDCGLMAQNIMLSAWSLGVGSVCLGSPVRFLTDNDICSPYLQRLGFSDGYELCLCVGLGYADEAPDAKPRDMDKVKFVTL
ncbi:MAG: nitroreductase family protein [Bacteroidaceae bacterium]|jgi:nitroreductase|nr:nitroreductase family protein [Bacteroidaceae bacterium]